MRIDDVTAIVLCGGAGSRLGAVDKTLTPVAGRPLVSHTLSGLAPQVGRIVLSCGRDAAPYAELGHDVVVDAQPGQGPLGGVTSALGTVETDWILLHPGDTPFPDPRLVARLGPTAEVRGIAVPRSGEQRQHLVLLLSRPMADELAAWYRAGGRAIRRWLDERAVESVDMSDASETFFNVNTRADLALAEERAASA
ncbi:MAG: molybdenum cofactor guanylyltransferase [Candidatus Limnocylindrales bacterium]